jgi:ribosome-binding protein aMBF1 (putative translation factor)
MLDQTLQRIRDFATARGLSPAALARQANLHPNTLRDMHRADWRPSFSTLSRLELVMRGEPVPEPRQRRNTTDSASPQPEPEASAA